MISPFLGGWWWLYVNWWVVSNRNFIFYTRWDVILPIDFHIFQDSYRTTNQKTSIQGGTCGWTSVPVSEARALFAAPNFPLAAVQRGIGALDVSLGNGERRRCICRAEKPWGIIHENHLHKLRWEGSLQLWFFSPLSKVELHPKYSGKQELGWIKTYLNIWGR
jgi:hypothetical protein